MDGFCVRGNLSPTELCVFNRFLKRPNAGVGGCRGGYRNRLPTSPSPTGEKLERLFKKASLSSTVPQLEGPHTWTRGWAGLPFREAGEPPSGSVRMKNQTESQSPNGIKEHLQSFPWKGSRSRLWSCTGDWEIQTWETQKGGGPENTGLHSCFILQFCIVFR